MLHTEDPGGIFRGMGRGNGVRHEEGVLKWDRTDQVINDTMVAEGYLLSRQQSR